MKVSVVFAAALAASVDAGVVKARQQGNPDGMLLPYVYKPLNVAIKFTQTNCQKLAIVGWMPLLATPQKLSSSVAVS
jgi:hypothetical protein